LPYPFKQLNNNSLLTMVKNDKNNSKSFIKTLMDYKKIYLNNYNKLSKRYEEYGFEYDQFEQMETDLKYLDDLYI
ncbi:unnamed protein product, partial [Didymodactylos carnosus]